jgi:autotransporter-associated beta strand protein
MKTNRITFASTAPGRFARRLATVLSAAACLLSPAARAELVGPYTPDANTLFLLHFDEAADGSVATNAGLKGGNFYSVSEATASATPPVVTTMLGAPSYVNGPTNFNSCMTNPTAGYLFGFDFNRSGAYDGDVNGTTPSADRLAMTNLNIGFNGKSAFTLEAIIRPTTNAVGLPSGEIICTDSSQANTARGFQFRLTSGGSAGTVQFQAIGVSQAVSGTVPTTGPDAFVPGEWYHVALTYDGAKATIYWTKLDPANGAAHVLSSASLNLSNNFGVMQAPLCVGNENRGAAAEQFLGCIDEVRISSVCRAPNQMQFYSPQVTITQNPTSQNVDYNQPLTFSVGASSLTALGYQWRFNSSPIPDATGSSYSITHVAAGNAGYYDVVVTNAAGYAATSSPAMLVVGAANFISHRYSFVTDTSDSIGGAWGTNNGNAVVAGGKLVLDGAAGTYMQMPANMFNSASASALTFEFWATFGANPNNVRVFDFGFTTGANGFNYVGFTPHSAAGHQIVITPGDVLFQQTVAAAGTLDGLTRHIACVVDPPNKTLAIYTNGVLEAVNTNMTVNIANLNDTLSYLGRSLFTADPYLNASIDEFRIYNGALSGISLKQSDDQGPDTLLADGPAEFVTQPVSVSVPTGQTASFTAAAIGYLPISYQWFKNSALVLGATNVTYSFTATLADNGATVVCFATNTVGVTTYVTNSHTATLSVFTPPTLAWLDTAHGGADGSWNTTSPNWLSGSSIVAFTQTNGVLFDSRGSGSPTVDVNESIIPYNITVDATSDYTFASSGTTGALEGQGGLTKRNTGKLTIGLTNNLSGPVTISGGTLQVGNADSSGTLGTGVVTNNATLVFNRSDTALAVPNAIRGTGSVSFDGTGATTISGANDYSGGTFLNAGIVYLRSGTGLGNATSGTAVADGAQLYITANVDLAEALTLSGIGDGSGSLRKGGAGATTASGPITFIADSTISVDSGATLTLSNTVSSTNMLTATGGGTLALGTNNNLTGGFTLAGPAVNVGAAQALGTGPITINGAGRFVIGTGLTVTNAFTANVASAGVGYGVVMAADNTNGTVTTVTGPITFNASPANGGNFVGPGTSGYLHIAGPVTNTATGVISSRAGNVRYSGGGDYTTFTLGQGIVSLGAHNGICPNATAGMSASGASTFDLNGFNQSLTGLSDTAANATLITNTSATLATLTLNIAGGSTYNGATAGNLALVKSDAGVLLLNGTNITHTGNTVVNGGTLELAQPSLSSRTTVVVANGATLQLDFAGTNTVTGLVLAGVSQAAGVYSSATSTPFLTGTGSLLVNPVATNPTNIVFSVSGSTLTLSWPADHIGWRLLEQTNRLALGISTTPSDWGTVSGSTTTNLLNIPIDAAKPAAFYRMVYP